MSLRIGFGIDFHQLVTNREFWLGGVKIDHPKGALGHSDADVLLHAICDAMLGAACLGDIGVHFPDVADLHQTHVKEVNKIEAKRSTLEAFFGN